MKDVIVIGAGLTGLTLGYRLVKGGADVLLVEKNDRIGGQIQTHEEGGFVFESGPNTGVVSSSEVARLFMDLKDRCRMVTARESFKESIRWEHLKKFQCETRNPQEIDREHPHQESFE